MNVIAVPSAPANDPALQGKRTRLSSSPPPGWRYTGYSSLQDLVDRLKDLLKNSDDCISTLEIDAHGSPTSCDWINDANAQNFGEQLGLLNKFCKDCKVYLTGCNTGVSWPPPPLGTIYPMAKILAMSTNCTVYGTIGYTSGTHAEGTAHSTRSCIYNGHYYAPIPGCQTAAEERADRCYKPYTRY